MAEIRGFSLAAHASAREAKEDNAACFAARAAGQAVATAHVPQHAFGAVYYALKALASADPAHAEVRVAKERNWQSRRLPRNLTREFLNRVIVLRNDHEISIKIEKGKGF
jgi:immunity protein 5 of polymorphic toxin system